MKHSISPTLELEFHPPEDEHWERPLNCPARRSVFFIVYSLTGACRGVVEVLAADGSSRLVCSMRHGGGIDDPADFALELIGVSGGSLLVRTMTLSGQGDRSTETNDLKFFDLVTGLEVQSIHLLETGTPPR